MENKILTSIIWNIKEQKSSHHKFNVMSINKEMILNKKKHHERCEVVLIGRSNQIQRRRKGLSYRNIELVDIFYRHNIVS